MHGAVLHNKAGLQAIRAGVVVDCSADADVAFRAGAPTQKGRESDGKMQPMTMFFVIEDVDDAAVEAHIRAHPEEEGQLFHAVVEAARAAGRFPIERDKIGIYRTPEPGVWRVNTTRLLGLDGTNPRDLTRAEVAGRRQVFALLDFMRRECPGLSRVKLREIAAQIGVRETRRIVGEYVLTMEDLAAGTRFPDVIALSGYPVDIHPVDGGGGGIAGGARRRAASGRRLPDPLPLAPAPRRGRPHRRRALPLRHPRGRRGGAGDAPLLRHGAGRRRRRRPRRRTPHRPPGARPQPGAVRPAPPGRHPRLKAKPQAKPYP